MPVSVHEITTEERELQKRWRSIADNSQVAQEIYLDRESHSPQFNGWLVAFMSNRLLACASDLRAARAKEQRLRDAIAEGEL
jgi:hypothetical protein